MKNFFYSKKLKHKDLKYIPLCDDIAEPVKKKYKKKRSWEYRQKYIREKQEQISATNVNIKILKIRSRLNTSITIKQTIILMIASNKK